MKLSHVLAEYLVEPSIVVAGHYRQNLQREYKNLNKEYLNADDYEKARTEWYTDKIKFIKNKNNGNLDFNLTDFIENDILTFFSMIEDTNTGEFYEHDKFRELKNWSQKGINTTYKVEYSNDVRAVKDYKLIAKTENKEITLDFTFLKYKGTIDTAAQLSATVEFLNEVKSHLDLNILTNKPSNGGRVGQKIEPPIGKMRWYLGRPNLKKLFTKMATERHDGYGKNLIDAEDSDIDSLIDGNFIWKDGNTPDAPMIPLENKVIYYGNLSALIRLFYYLYIRKDKESKKAILETDQYKISSFISNNFLINDVKNGTNEISYSTVNDYWIKCAHDYETKFKGTYDDMLKWERKGRERNKCIIDFLTEELI